MVKPYSLLLYFLSLITSFFIGISFAGIIEAGKNQGLAAAPIVLGYGIISGVAGLGIASFVTKLFSRKIIYKLNIILALCIVGFYAYYQISFLKRKNEKVRNKKIQNNQKAPITKPDESYVRVTLINRSIWSS